MAHKTKTKTITQENGKKVVRKTTTKTTKKGTKTKSTTRVSGKLTNKVVEKRKTGEVGDYKTVIKKRSGRGKDKVKTTKIAKGKNVKDNEGGVYTDVYKKSSKGEKLKIKSKALSGSKSKGTTTFYKQKVKEKGKKTAKLGYYTGGGTGKRKTKVKGY